MQLAQTILGNLIKYTYSRFNQKKPHQSLSVRKLEREFSPRPKAHELR
jgi:hypothetical protein